MRYTTTAPATDWSAQAQARLDRAAQLAPWKPAPLRRAGSICGGDAYGDAEQAARLQDHSGYTQPCSGPVGWEVDGIPFCDKHLVQSER